MGDRTPTQAASGFWEAVAGAVMRARWWILAAWAVGVLALVLGGVPRFAEDGLSLRELAPTGAPEVSTELDAARLFRMPLNARTQVVRRAPDGLSAAVQRGDIDAALEYSRAVQRAPVDKRGAIALALPITNALTAFPSSREASTTTITNLVGYPTSTVGARNRAAREYADDARARAPGAVFVTGGIPAQLATGDVIHDALGRLQVASIVVLALIAALWFRSLVAPLIVLVAIAATLLLLLEALAAVGSITGRPVPAEALPVITAVAIGVATDYALFFLAAWNRTGDTCAAIARIAPVVLTAGITTSIGVGALLLAEMGFITAFAPALVIAIVAAMVVALGLVPALICVCGSAVMWPRRPRPRPSVWTRRLRDGFFAHRGRAVGVAVVIGLVVVGLAATASRAPVGFNIITSLDDDTEAARGADEAARGFAAGILSPTLLVVDGRDLDVRRAELARFGRAVAEHPGVAGVLGPDAVRAGIERAGLGDVAARLENELSDPEQVTEGTPAPARDPASAAVAGVLVTPDGNHARLVVVLERDAFSGVAADVLRTLRPRLAPIAAESGLDDVTVRVAGDTALVQRVVDTLNADLMRIIAVLIPIQLLVLWIALRSVTVSLVVIISSVLTTAAALGVAGLYDRAFGPGDGLVFFVPIATLVLLLGVGVDYGVLMGRALRDQEHRDGPDQAAAAVATAAPTIIVAGIVLAATFSMLAVVPLESFRQFAVAMSAGVVIDALVVRSLLMPVIVARLWRGPSVEAPT